MPMDWGTATPKWGDGKWTHVHGIIIHFATEQLKQQLQKSGLSSP